MSVAYFFTQFALVGDVVEQRQDAGFAAPARQNRRRYGEDSFTSTDRGGELLGVAQPSGQ